VKRFADYLAEAEAPEPAKAEAPAKPRRFADYLAEAEAADTPPAQTRSTSVTLTPERQEKVDDAIARTSLPQKGSLAMAGEAIAESQKEVNQQVQDRLLFGVPGSISRWDDARKAETAQIASQQAAKVWPGGTGRAATFPESYGARPQVIPEPGKGDAHRPEDYAPVEGTLASLPAAALDMATIGGTFGKAGQTVGQAPAAIARRLGATEAQAAVRPGVQLAADAAATGALYSGADTAMRGGTLGEVLASMPEGAAGNLLMSHLPAAVSKTENFLSRRVAANDLRPIKQMSKKGTLDKELIQFGGGDPEKGAQEMLAFVQRENLGPILRQKGSAAVNQYEAAKSKVYEQDLKPIYEHAYKAEPGAAVPFDEIATRLRANIRKKGGNEHRLVEKAIDEIKARTELVGKTGNVPLEAVLTNARDFQAAGHAGVVNYDAPPESKVVMRQVGQVLRGIANEKVAAIYKRNPEAAHALFTSEAPKRMGATFRDQPSTPGTMKADDYPNARARRYENFQEYAADVPNLLAEGNKRFSDYAKLEPMVRQASVLKAGEKKWGLMNMLGHGMSGTVGGAAGYLVGGFPGAVVGTGMVEAGRASYPYAVRAANATAGTMSGPAVPALTRAPVTGEEGGSMIAGAILAKYGQKALDEYERARARLREAKR
jgi:hypothetical protein